MCDKISTDELQLPMMDLPSMTPQIVCVKNDLYLYNDINQDTAKNVISSLYDMALTIINSCLNILCKIHYRLKHFMTKV